MWVRLELTLKWGVQMKFQSENNEYSICYVKRLKQSVPQLLRTWLEQHSETSKIVIVTDTRVHQVQAAEIALIQQSCYEIPSVKHVACYLVPEGEKSKSVSVAEDLWSHLADLQFTRSDLLIAFGGGMIGDLVGFCAATFLRGISFIQIPTTLLSQIDSSVGGKVAINLSQGKNLVGQFYNPVMVIINVSYLETLETSVLKDGLGELIKYGVMCGHTLIDNLLTYKCLEDFRQVLVEEPIRFEEIIYECLFIKSVVVETDFRENNIRKFLNLGHTIGHAIEQAMDYKLGHGHCVIQGIWWSTQIALSLTNEDTGLSAKEKEIKLCNLMKLSHQLEVMIGVFQFEIYRSITINTLMKYIGQDKKQMVDGVQMVLPTGNLTEDFLGGDMLDIYAASVIIESLQNQLEIKKISMVELERLMIKCDIVFNLEGSTHEN
jgi:3-dehydroquinate synthase